MTAALAIDHCPGCGTATEPRHAEGHVHATFCFDCSLDDLGQTWEQIKARTAVVEKKAAKRMAGGRVDQVNLG